MEKLVYLLEDDDSICDLVKCTLQLNDISCATFGSVRAFRDAVTEKPPRIAVLDIMLPDGNGLDVLTWLKSKHTDVYCIMLSALGKESDKVNGLNLGADDYIAKPFGILEFSAKIAAVFRRMKKKPTVFEVGNVFMDCEKMLVTLDGREINLSGKEFRRTPLQCLGIRGRRNAHNRQLCQPPPQAGLQLRNRVRGGLQI